MVFRKGFLLTQAVLASTLFVSQHVYADQISTTVNTTQETSSTSNNVLEITPTGQVSTNGEVGVEIDSNNGSLIVRANNINGNEAIVTTGGVDGVQINNPGGSVSIGANSGITASDDGISVNATGATISNAGTVISDSSAIHITKTGSATVLDSPSGVLTGSTTQGFATFLLDADATVSSSLQNEGLIQALNGQNALQFGSNMAKVTNWGTISATDPANATVYANGDITITNGLVNHGSIFSGTGKAIDLSSAATTFYQYGGTVTGSVNLPATDAAGGGNVFVMEGGTLTGGVFANTTVGVQNTIQLNGGNILSLELGGNGDTLNMNGGTLFALTGGEGDDIFNITGGDIFELNGGLGDDVLNVNKSWISNAIMSGVESINVNNSGTVYTVKRPINGVDTALTVNPGTTLIQDNLISGDGTFTNNGTWVVVGSAVTTADTFTNNSLIQLDTNSLMVAGVTSAFTHNAGAVLEVSLGGPGAYGQMAIQGAAVDLADDSYIAPQIVGFIPQGSTFNVINNPADGINDGSGGNGLVINQPDSITLSFTKNLVNDGAKDVILQLLTTRIPYNQLSSSAATLNVSAAMDVLAQGVGPSDPDLLSLFWNMDLNTTQEGIENDMQSLVPPYNYGLVEGSHLGMQLVFNGLEARLGDIHWQNRTHAANDHSRIQVAQNGLSFGDNASHFGGWIKALGGNVNQGDRHSAPGYKANAGGGAIGLDWGFSDTFVVGIAGSFTKVKVDGKGPAPKDQAIKSYQGTVYGWYEPFGALFFDGMFGLARENINTNRVITGGSLVTAAQASFHGTQYGGQADLGYDFMKDTNCFFAPVVRVKYLHLELDNYTESGAGGASLVVNNDNDLNELAGGVGLRVGMMMDEGSMVYVPELSAMLSYDFKVDAEQTIANFVGGGPAFATPGIRPGRTFFDLGLGLNAYVSSSSIFTIRYDLTLRDKFMGNAGYVQYYYRW